MRMLFVSIASTASLLVGIGLASAQTITNGGFETPAPPAGGFTLYNPGANIGGFTVFGNAGSNVAVISNTFSDNTGTNNARSGNAFLDLTGSVDTDQLQGVSQTISTMLGQAYTLSFYVGHRTDDGAPTVLGVSTTGANGAYTNFTNSNQGGTPGVGSIAYQMFSLTFVASGTSTDLAFRNNGAVGTGMRSVALDDISIAQATQPSPVPGPIAGAGLPALVGLAGALFVRRRQQRRAG